MFEKVKLASKRYPAGPNRKFSAPILVLHGLFGSSKNWVAVCDYLSEFSEVFSLDLRNHGDSPHSPEHNLRKMSEDVLEFVNDQGLSEIILLGHSMGGLVAMTFALENPERVKHLIVQDIAPRDYPFRYESELSVLQLDVSGFRSRQEIDAAASKFVADPFIRNFLLMNLERREAGGYAWKLNVPAIAESKRIFESQFSSIGDRSYNGTVLFIVGGASEYFLESDKRIALKYFPSASFQTIPGGDHYIHFTKAAEFKRILLEYLNRL